MTTYKKKIENLKENLKKTEFDDIVKQIDDLLIQAVDYADTKNVSPIKQKILLKFIFFRLKCPFSFLFFKKQVFLGRLKKFTNRLLKKIK
ncbi:MAG: hypothetical protein WCG32_04620, partial [Actinomycetes bacterium]